MGPPSKKARVEATDPFQEVVDGAFKLLVGNGKMKTHEEVMLRAATPFALTVGRDARHPYQTEVATHMSRTLHILLASKKEAIEAEESKKEAIAADRNLVSSTREDLVSKENQRREACESAEKTLAVARDAVVAAKNTHSVALEAVSRLEVDHEKTKSEKTQREVYINETWSQLKEGTMPGRQWLRKISLSTGWLRY